MKVTRSSASKTEATREIWNYPNHYSVIIPDRIQIIHNTTERK